MKISMMASYSRALRSIRSAFDLPIRIMYEMYYRISSTHAFLSNVIKQCSRCIFAILPASKPLYHIYKGFKHFKYMRRGAIIYS